MLQEKVNKLEKRVAELEKQLDAQKRGLHLLTDNQLKYIEEFFMEYEILSVCKQENEIIIIMNNFYLGELEYTLDELKAQIDEDMRMYIHDLVDCKTFDPKEMVRAIYDYNEFLETWDK